jgi:hypothetical protein
VTNHNRRSRRRQALRSRSSLERRQRQRRPTKKVVAFSAVDLVVGSPTFGEPALGQRLSADDLVVGSPTLSEAALGQRRWRTVRNAARREGRPPTDPALIGELQGKLEPWLQDIKSKGREPPKQDPDCIEFVQDQLESRNRVVGRSTILRKVVQPVHQKLVHRKRWR